MILRTEDLDATRARPEAAEGALVDLRWLGLDWDEGPDVGGPSDPYVQSRRMASYETSLGRLRSAERVYPCTCSRLDIERAASAPHPEDEGPTYPGTCSNRTARDAEALGDRPFAWRFRVPDGPVAWRDLFLGDRSIDPRRVGGDFVVGRSGVGPSYQLAVVHDDSAMGRDRGDPRRRPRLEHSPSNSALSRPGLGPTQLRPRAARRRPRRPAAGQAGRLAQAGEPARGGRRPPPPGRLAGPGLRLGRAGRSHLAGGLARSIRPPAIPSRAWVVTPEALAELPLR